MRLVLIVALVACRGGSSEKGPDKDPDCVLMQQDLATAPVRLSEKYPGDPVKVSETIERCIAPTGEPCERIAKIVRAIPSMMPGGGSAMAPTMSSARIIELCEGMVPEMRRCMLPSYVNGHADECREVLNRMEITSVDVNPSAGSGMPPQAPDCAELTIELGKDKIRYARAAETGEMPAADLDILEATVKRLAGKCTGLASLKADPTTSYQDMITVMDIAVKVGFREIVVDSGEPSPPGPMDPAPPDLVSDRGDALQNAPVIIITKSEVMFGGETVVPVGRDATEPVRAALAGQPAPDPDRMLAIIQADQSTSAKTIIQVINGAKRAGYSSIMFAVKNR